MINLRRVLPGAVTFFAVAFVLVLAGCGGNGRLSQSAFREQVDRTCAERQAAVGALSNPVTKSEYAANAAQTVKLVKTEITALEAIKPPASDQETFDKMIAHQEQLLTLYRQFNDLVLKKITPGRKATIERILVRMRAEKAAFRSAARDLNLKACSGTSASG